MKSRSHTSLLGLLGLILLGAPVWAADPYIYGQIQFSGGVTLNGPLQSATAFTSYFDPLGTGGPQVATGTTDDYSVVPVGTEASFSLFTFNPAPGSVPDLWSFSLGTTQFSFDATTVEIAQQSSTFLTLQGTGVAHITGYTDTIGTWSLVDTGSGPAYSFGFSILVPEPSSVALLACGIIAFVVSRRRQR